ncbi:family 27 glycoside hydrolase [Macrophomina phaseolina]|uniref:Alpha-galactosidase n=1 Tax=Macrophomina phaseolina TaxID=35725 RepID=A0ABQ8GF52_9PEZI|nr:family 27 glycoside hydrolase [Macrophomina phaseolina]
MFMTLHTLILASLSPLIVHAQVLHYGTTPNGFKSSAKGWNSFALQSLGGNLRFHLNQDNVIRQCDAMRDELGEYGYEYCSLDSGWSLPSEGDEFGRIAYDTSLFDIPSLAEHLHSNGAKLGIYILPGFFAKDAEKTIFGTHIKLSSIQSDEKDPCRAMERCNINYSASGAQEWCNSNVQQFADWGVDLLKLDYVTPGSPDAGADLSADNSGSVACYHKAIEKVGREIRLDISWKLERNSTYYDIWKTNADSMRTDQDINNSGKSTLTEWRTVQRAIEQYRQYVLPQLDSVDTLTIYPDLDSLLVANAQNLTGLTNSQRQAVLSHWIGAGANLFLGSDLTAIDAFGKSLLTNPLANEIANFTAAYPMVPTRGNTNEQKGQQTQVWIAGPDGESGVVVVLLANYGANGDNDLFESTPDDADQRITLSPKELGLTSSGYYSIEDVWGNTKIDLGYSDEWTWTLEKEGAAALLRFTPSLSSENATETKRAVNEPQKFVQVMPAHALGSPLRMMEVSAASGMETSSRLWLPLWLVVLFQMAHWLL